MNRFRFTAAMVTLGFILMAQPRTLFAHGGEDESPCDELAEGGNKEDVAVFKLLPNPKFLSCLADNSGSPPRAIAVVKRGNLSDRMCLQLEHIKPGLNFDLFTVERSSLLATGTVDPAPKGFGLAWYQSDIHINESKKRAGTGVMTIKTVLLDQIFGFDPDVGLAPTNTFHVGFWFNDPNDAAACGFTGFTPFNGEHRAGPLAMISVPNRETNLGPLCLRPDTSTNPPRCNP